MGILDYFDLRQKRKPRDAQRAVLLKVEQVWNQADVLCIRVPTAGGKSALADCISTWQAAQKQTVSVVVPDNLLLAQYEKEAAKESRTLWAQRFVECTWKGLDDRPVTGTRANCPWESCRLRFTQRCPYQRMLKPWQAAKYKISNYYMPLAQKIVDKTNIVVIDEAHLFIRYLSGLSARRMWHHDFDYPLEASTLGQLKSWCKKELDLCTANKPLKKDDPKRYKHWENLQLLWKEISDDSGKYSICSTVAEYRGETLPCIEIKPIEVKDALPLVINRKVTNKIVLLSATLSEWDVADLGLDKTRVAYIDCESPIPVQRRPVYVRPCISNRAVDGYKDLTALMNLLGEAASKYPNEKGIVHCTYDMSKALRLLPKPDSLLPRLLFHTNVDKRQVLQKFLESKEPLILIACGLAEGLDLKNDLARFNIIAKIAWQSLEDMAVKRKFEENPDAYMWHAARLVMQAAGRVCRDPKDFGATYILDSSFNKIPERMWLPWFKEAMCR